MRTVNLKDAPAFYEQLTKEIQDAYAKATLDFAKPINGPSIIPNVEVTTTLSPNSATKQDALDVLDEQIAAKVPELANKVRMALDAAITAVGAVDTGRLRSSLSISTDRDGLTIDYSSPYANLVHYGGYIQPYGNPNARPVYQAPRPWVEIALSNLQIE
jgi:hypothetical protein